MNTRPHLHRARYLSPVSDTRRVPETEVRQRCARCRCRLAIHGCSCRRPEVARPSTRQTFGYCEWLDTPDCSTSQPSLSVKA